MENVRKNEIVYDLLLIQAERATLYERMVRYLHMEEAPFCGVLKKISFQSRQFLTELRRHIDMTSHEPADRVEIKGEIYSCWPETQYHLSADPVLETLNCCESIENALIHAYEKALEAKVFFNDELQQVLHSHLIMIREAAGSLYAYKIKPSAPEIIFEERMPFSYSREMA